MANLVTLIRLFLLFALVVNAYSSGYLLLINLPLLIIIFVLDGVDGYVARKRHEESLFGSIFDIAADRIVENVLWLVLMDLGLVPFWVPLVFIIRSLFVDSIRSHVAAIQGQTPFGMMQSPVGRFLVSGRFMRIFYAALKAVTFGYIFLIQPWPALLHDLYLQWFAVIMLIKETLIYTTVFVCLLRGLPVLVEFFYFIKSELQIQQS
jgi:CDP-diacylglycerol--glycerol-3-phosphate 3-phosphatidyltransferase